MEFRLVQHANAALSSGSGFLSPRRIRFAGEIPLVGLYGFEREPRPLRLRGVVDSSDEAFVRVHGAFRQGPFWCVSRRDPFPFDLGEHLPRMAHLAIVPEMPFMVSPSPWRWNLSALMRRTAWDRLVAEVWRRERVCCECGAVPFRPSRLEGWECWEEELVGGVARRRLVAIRVLCPLCLEMKSLAEARAAGNFERAAARLAAINRIDPRRGRGGEIDAYVSQIVSRRSVLPEDDVWELDLSVLAGRDLEMGDAVGSAEGVLLHHRGGRTGLIRVPGAEIRLEGRTVVVRPY